MGSKINFKKEQHNNDSEFILIKFQAWKYQNTPAIWAYLYETISEKYFSDNWFRQKLQIFRLSVKRRGHFDAYILPLLTLFLGIIWFMFLRKEQLLENLILKIGGLIPLGYFVYRLIDLYRFSIRPAKKFIKSFTTKPSFTHILGLQAEIQKELIFLLKAWGKKLNGNKRNRCIPWRKIRNKKRLLLFIDDLDRCSENRIIEIVDAVRIMLDDRNINQYLIALVAVDKGILKRAIDNKYQNVGKNLKLDNLIKEYFDKLFISSIQLPPISKEKRADFIENLVSQINPVYEFSKEVGEITESGQVEEKKQNAERKKEIEIEFFIAEFEKELLKTEITKVPDELTPRQMRILVYRYLLARNLSKVLIEDRNFESAEMIKQIIHESFENYKFDKENDVYDEIVKMVAAY